MFESPLLYPSRSYIYVGKQHRTTSRRLYKVCCFLR
ncbi:B2 bradykinin receptor [Frankliniella fusca]|uniref:B2 bradykinin receptor n=1 Tax=Frankliniella fusca TaxID=407009 RepID=A0AAE1GTL7_9NEOP|nr:B2 bradykinin receptor [Frankliniella fusca]